MRKRIDVSGFQNDVAPLSYLGNDEGIGSDVVASKCVPVVGVPRWCNFKVLTKQILFVVLSAGTPAASVVATIALSMFFHSRI
jgi:hypothetical protein